MLPGRVDHSYLVHSATCQIQTTIWRGNHVAYHTAAGWDLHSAEALRFEIEPDQRIRLQARLAVPNFTVFGDCDSVRF